ncbi:hypothetical protein [Micromonospora aurantiaca (nom. illeg.)]|uniref:hypothetical protein n=1 Tax=Micromonospora aurantiaca (nom. illeg.) TaxID=47850 RepID=UPI0035B0A110
MTDNRRRIYVALLNDPARAWTVRELSCAVPTVAGGAVRDTVNQLLAEGLLRPVPHRRVLTAALTGQGRQKLTQLLREGGTRTRRRLA